jgi:RNA polymerase I-specific transcription initiation factor RRN7
VLYGLTKKLSNVLSLSLTLHHSLAPKLKRASKRDPERYRYDNVPPEVAFMAVVIVALKIMHGLDGRARSAETFFRHGSLTKLFFSRQPDRMDDPVHVQPRLDDYLTSLRSLDLEEDKAKANVYSADRPM